MGGAGTPLRIALVRAVSGDEHAERTNGFLPRYRLLTRLLAEESRELLVVLRGPDEDHVRRGMHEIPRGVVAASVVIEQQRHTRTRRVGAAARSLLGVARPARWELELIDRLERFAPDVIVAPAHPVRDHARPLTGIAPTVLFVEEDPAPYESHGSTAGRALRAVELAAERRRVAPPAVVVVISDRERAWARATFPRSTVRVVPHSLDTAYWSATPERAGARDEVFVIGRLGHERNADALGRIAGALSEIGARGVEVPKLVVASADPPHSSLGPAARQLIDFVGAVDDPRPFYSSAAATLVPSFVVTGAKTTVLQGWAARCPVVTTTASAASVGGTPDVDLYAGDSPEAVAELLVRAVLQPADARRVADAGFRRYSQRHTEGAVREALRGVLADAVGTPPAEPSVIADMLASRRVAS